jgi:hypothetical protein
MRSITQRAAVISLSLTLAYVSLPTANDSGTAQVVHQRISNGISLNGRSMNGRMLSGRELDQRAKGRLSANGKSLNGRKLGGAAEHERAKGKRSANGSSLQGETPTVTSETGGMSVSSIKLPPSAQPGRICLKCR